MLVRAAGCDVVRCNWGNVSVKAPEAEVVTLPLVCVVCFSVSS